MAKYKILNTDTKRDIYEFLIDKVSDLNSLPKNVGSTVFVVDTNEKYICNNAKEWKILSNNNSYSGSDDSGGAGGGGVMYVTFDDNDTLDASFNDIMNAYNAGKYVLARYEGSGHIEINQLVYTNENVSNYCEAIFMGYSGSGEAVTFIQCIAPTQDEPMYVPGVD